MKKNYLLILILLYNLCLAQNPSAIDPTFNPYSLPANNIFVNTTGLPVVCPDGKVLLRVTDYKGTGIVRLNENNIDLDLRTRFDSSPASFAVQPDGKMIFAAMFDEFDGVPVPQVVRLNVDGSLDNAFVTAVASSISAVVSGVVLQHDGKIIVSGGFGSGGTSQLRRLNPDGSLDNSYMITGNLGSAWLVQPDNKLLIGRQTGSATQNILYRYNEDGTLDASFTSALNPSTPFEYIGLQPDGKILVADGNYQITGGFSRIARLNPDGSIDATFTPPVNQFGFSNLGSTMDSLTPQIRAISVQPDGKLIVVGHFHKFNEVVVSGIVRLNSNGTLDPTYNTGSTGFRLGTTALQLFEPDFVQLTPDGKLLVSGRFYKYNNETVSCLMKLNPDGSVYTPYKNHCRGFNDSVNSMYLYPDGKLMVAGNFTAYNGITANRLARLNADGTLDPTFTSGKAETSTIKAAVVQSDGKIVVIGGTGPGIVYNGTPVEKGIYRLLPDGTLDTAFNAGTGFDNAVNSLAIQPDDKILVGGAFTSYNGTPRRNFVRLLSDGSIDPNYANQSFADAVSPSRIFLHPDGRITLSSALKAKRYFADGTPDNSFTYPINQLNGMHCLLPDGKMIFTKSSLTDGIKRLNEDGSIDTGLAANINGNPFIDVCALPSGKLLAFRDGTIYRLNLDGSADASFEVPVGFNSAYNYKIIIQPDDKILVAGYFQEYNGEVYYNIIRLMGGEQPLDLQEFDSENGFVLSPNPATQTLHITTPFKITAVSVYNSLGQKIIERESAGLESIDISNLAKGNYWLRMTSNNKTTAKPFIKR